jgi:hypothetical protein
MLGGACLLRGPHEHCAVGRRWRFELLFQRRLLLGHAWLGGLGILRSRLKSGGRFRTPIELHSSRASGGERNQHPKPCRRWLSASRSLQLGDQVGRPDIQKSRNILIEAVRSAHQSLLPVTEPPAVDRNQRWFPSSPSAVRQPV